jgi:predicted Zn-dependent protease
MLQKKSQKIFSDEFDKFLNLLRSEENFAFSRFSDGELFMLKGERLVLAENNYITGELKGHGVYPKEEQKDFDPERDKFYQEKLVEALQYRKKNYYKGLTGLVDEDIAGEGSFQFQLDLCGEGDEEHLSYSNVFINNNYPKFIEHILPILSQREIIFIANESATFDKLPFKVIKHFKVGSNCIINDYNLVEDIKVWIKENNIKNKVFLFSASTLSNYIIHECFRECDENTYMDIGTCLSPWMGLEGWRHTRAYLQHWVLGMPNKYGTQEDTWI